MKEIYLIRHAEKDDSGHITENGQLASRELANRLPPFDYVYSSPSERAKLTAALVSGAAPTVDERAVFYMASPEKSEAINNLANENQIPFLDAMTQYGDSEVLDGVADKATALNNFINEILASSPDNSKSLIVSHDLSISPAMQQRGIPLGSIDFLCGYVINGDGNITQYTSSPA